MAVHVLKLSRINAVKHFVQRRSKKVQKGKTMLKLKKKGGQLLILSQFPVVDRKKRHRIAKQEWIFVRHASIYCVYASAWRCGPRLRLGEVAAIELRSARQTEVGNKVL